MTLLFVCGWVPWSVGTWMGACLGHACVRVWVGAWVWVRWCMCVCVGVCMGACEQAQTQPESTRIIASGKCMCPCVCVCVCLCAYYMILFDLDCRHMGVGEFVRFSDSLSA